MSNGTLPTGLDALSATRLTNKQGTSKDVGQDEFFKLMIAQLKNQDPMKPMENGEFLTQIAQFSTVNGIRELQVPSSTSLSPRQIWRCLRLKLWDEQGQRMLTWREARNTSRFRAAVPA